MSNQAFDRTTIITGPAVISIRSHLYYTEGNIKETLKRKVWSPKTAVFGELGARLVSDHYELEFTPAPLLSYAGTVYTPVSNLGTLAGCIGTSIFGATDSPTFIQTRAGQLITYANGAVTKLPNLFLGVGKPFFAGGMTVACIGKLATDPGLAGYFNTVAATVFADTSFATGTIREALYTAAFGSNYPLLFSEEGFEVTVGLKVKEQEVNGFGVQDITLEDVNVEASFKPLNLTEADFYRICNSQSDVVTVPPTAGAVVALLPGQEIGTTGQDLVIAGSPATLTLTQAGITDVEKQYDAVVKRGGPLKFKAAKTFTTGAMNPPLILTIN